MRKYCGVSRNLFYYGFGVFFVVVERVVVNGMFIVMEKIWELDKRVIVI